MIKKYIFSFEDPKISKIKNKKNILGGKGANLAEMGKLGLPVPPGFTISTEVCDIFYKNKKKLPGKIVSSISSELKKIEPSFADKIQFTKDKMENFDAVIATGSDNSARYFEHYFGKFPSIIRKSRSSVAILDGTESKKELKALANDVFQYLLHQ